MAVRTSTVSFFIAGLCAAGGAVSLVVDALGPPLVFAFSTLCLVFVAYGALEAKNRR